MSKNDGHLWDKSRASKSSARCVFVRVSKLLRKFILKDFRTFYKQCKTIFFLEFSAKLPSDLKLKKYLFFIKQKNFEKARHPNFCRIKRRLISSLQRTNQNRPFQQHLLLAPFLLLASLQFIFFQRSKKFNLFILKLSASVYHKKILLIITKKKSTYKLIYTLLRATTPQISALFVLCKIWSNHIIRCNITVACFLSFRRIPVQDFPWGKIT